MSGFVVIGAAALIAGFAIVYERSAPLALNAAVPTP